MISRIGPVTSDAATARPDRSGLPEPAHPDGRQPGHHRRGGRHRPGAHGPGAACGRDASSTPPRRGSRQSSSGTTPQPPSGWTGRTAASSVWLGDRWFDVVGILEPVPLAPELDRAALDRVPGAHRLLHRRRGAVGDLRAYRSRPGSRAVAGRPRRHGRPGGTPGRRGGQPVRRADGAGRRVHGVREPLPIARRDRARGRRHRHRQRDGDRRARATRRDRTATGDGRPPYARRGSSS